MNKEIEVHYGRLGSAPELRYTKTQKPVCHLSMAINNHETKETLWKKIVVWGTQAELCNLYLRKGSEVFVQGQNQTRAYDDKEGNPKVIEEFNARLIGFPNIYEE